MSVAALPSTVGLAEAAGRMWDAVVIGAGPAGAVAAHQLACRGLAVLLVEKGSHPRVKVCGGCVSHAAMGALERIGVDAAQWASGSTLREFSVTVAGARATLALPGGLAITRATLDAGLVAQAIAAGSAYVDHTCGRVLNLDSGGRIVLLRRRGEETRLIARVVIAADGLAAPSLAGLPEVTPRVARRSLIGVSTALREAEDLPVGATDMTVGRGGYVGLVRMREGSVNVAAALGPSSVRVVGGPGEAVADIFREARREVPSGLPGARWHGTPPLTRRRRVEAERLLLIGDAAGFVEPFTGEGIAWAVESAIAAAPIAARLVRGEAAQGEWTRVWNALIVPRHRRCRIVAALLRSPPLARAAVSCLALVPRFGDLAAGRIAGVRA